MMVTTTSSKKDQLVPGLQLRACGAIPKKGTFVAFRTCQGCSANYLRWSRVIVGRTDKVLDMAYGLSRQTWRDSLSPGFLSGPRDSRTRRPT
jgi:hypothetical protein